MSKIVTTWQAPNGETINICSHHERTIKDEDWPRNKQGEEYCRVSVGMHRGDCDLCDADEVWKEN